MYEWHDILGNLGVVLIIGTYLLLQIDRISSHSSVFSGLNAVGAALILVSLMSEFNLSAFVIELFWLIISLLGLVYHASRRRRRPAGTQPR